MVTVMMQNAGKACDLPFGFSAALRSSPVFCLVDTVKILVEFATMLILGSSIRVAARLVWYDRFEKTSEMHVNPLFCLLDNAFANPMGRNTGESDEEDTIDDYFPDITTYCRVQENTRISSWTHDTMQVPNPQNDWTEEYPKDSKFYPGSSMDRAWRYSMAACFLGGLPQMIKVLAMRGVPITQVIVTIYLISFIVVELLRLVAGTAGEMEPRRTLGHEQTKIQLRRWLYRPLLFLAWLIELPCLCVFFYSSLLRKSPLIVILRNISAFIMLPIALSFVFKKIGHRFQLHHLFMSYQTRVPQTRGVFSFLHTLYGWATRLVTNIVPLEVSHAVSLAILVYSSLYSVLCSLMSFFGWRLFLQIILVSSVFRVF
ncbi:hypothetical protein BCR34DRAFT_560184 [Clohesyomyces aquaticus]|uniref:Uncharacterized protein n=1 Tax=Clohesyomyces aquaticus TaxID=1231657 RepID=A0A1Y1ZWC1_9PLEO|nr:hypothetical protein BCR34DRAFT_560184 [Clohesyomyces aquaticus]